MNPSLKRYQKESDYAYAYGVFPTLELLQYRPNDVVGVLLHSKGERNEGTRKIEAECARRGIGCEVNDKAIERIAPKENTYAIGVFRKYADSLHQTENHVILANPSDMGNMGTIIRTMCGFGIEDLALIRPAADIFDPRVIRASMGALFRLRFAYFDALEEYREQFAHKLYPFMTNGKVRLSNTEFKQPFALVFGNESTGLPESYRELGDSVSIPHSAGIDSLNLPVAAGIALYAATKGRFSR